MGCEVFVGMFVAFVIGVMVGMLVADLHRDGQRMKDDGGLGGYDARSIYLPTSGGYETDPFADQD